MTTPWHSRPMPDRHPVIAVGSNASPSQMRRKFVGHAIRPVVPMTLADVAGVAPGVSAHVSRWGYVPAAPVQAPGQVARLFVLWLDERELATLDVTEPNYRRRRLPAARHPATLESGARLPPCFVYVGRHGCLVDRTGRARRLTDQHTLIQALLDESAELRRLCGSTPGEFVSSVRDEATRDTVRRLFPAEGRVQSQPGLTDLPSAWRALRKEERARVTRRGVGWSWSSGGSSRGGSGGLRRRRICGTPRRPPRPRRPTPGTPPARAHGGTGAGRRG
ncbi:hypothetical protein ACIBP6_29275 [Nonomuraea terrae]|uniref:hypothetical protein n=1 Tax=Nonomuraea terrae TaxID=2530383 RepID=UPI00378E65A7